MPTDSTLPSRPVEVTVDNKAFFDGLAEDVVRLPRCTACEFVIWYPRHHCPSCGAGPEAIEWIEASGRGVVYSYTVVHRSPGSWGEVTPYVLAYVELDEGPRVMTNIVDCDPDKVHVDMAVRAVFNDVLRFTPA